MVELINDSRINYLISGYEKYSNFLIEFQSHIEKCSDYKLINNKDRNNYIKIINDMMRQLNTTYNLAIFENENYEEQSQYDYNNIKELIHIHNTLGIKKIKDPYEEINVNILEKISSNIGFPSIDIALSIIVDEQYKYLYDSKTNKLISLYNKIFIPMKYSFEENNNNEIIFLKKGNDLDSIIIINNCCKIYVRYNNKYIVLTGFFIQDPLNLVIRTSQLCNNHIFQRKKEIESFILSKKEINEKFVKSYMRNAGLADILSQSNTEFFDMISNDYKDYVKLIKMSFINLMKEFGKEDLDQKESIINMYNMIRLLLLGNDENVNIAGLLFSVTKEKKMDLEFSISDIIYKNLSYISQIKLRKTSNNIKNEINKIKTITSEDIDFKKQIVVCKYMPNSVKRAAFEKIEEMKSSNNEYYKQLLYVKTLLNFPWPSESDDTFFHDIGKGKDKGKNFLENVIQKLNNKVYGHKECKESIKELIGKWICNPSSAGTAIGLSGPPGVGKTLIAKAIGTSLGIPFVQITLGGQNDGELLHGHGYTYSGSQPGMIVKKMVEAGSSRCVMYFDELDKACKRYESNEIYNILIHLTDPNTNTEFQDRFFQEIKFPLNKVLFIFSYNDSNSIDSILMDRIKEIDVKPFKLIDKKNIVNKFLIDEMCELVGFENGSINISEECLDFIIDEYTNEPGVRDLKRKLEKIFLKLNIDRIYNKGIFEKNDRLTKKNPFILNKEIISEYLGKNKISIQYIHNSPLVGVINGLYATESGQGGILPIQIFDNYTNGDDKFTLKLTGSQRRVMRESVISAFTTAIHCIREDLRNEYLARNKSGCHIHATGSTPKDGPSGGGAFCIAFISRILNKQIKNDVAITGEIELTGKLTKIGGLNYKLPGAKRAGIKLVLVSNENSDDIEAMKKEYPDLFDNTFDIKLADNIRDALKYFLIDYDPTEII